MIDRPRVRIAPSPTGNLHIGTARTALFNFLFAKHYEGSLILRIEDTDTSRSTKEFAADIDAGLSWLMIVPDEGPDQGGEFGPYRQSERADLYKEAAKQLIEAGKAYPCFCTPEELEEGRREAQAKGVAYTYPGTCRNLSKEEVELRQGRGLKSVLRFGVPHNRRIVVTDLVKGPVEFNSSLLGDFVIQRADGVPLYSLANVVDDSAMKITHILRGEDLLPSTPNQLLLYESLGLKAPEFGHLPLLLNPDRTKLSKRKGATSVREFQREGYLSEALVNFIAFLGWSPGTEEEFFSIDQLVQKFSLDRVQKAGAVFDERRLRFINSHYLKALSTGELLKRLKSWLSDEKSHSDEGQELLHRWDTSSEVLKRAISTAKERAELLGDLIEPLLLFVMPPKPYSADDIRAASKDFSSLSIDQQVTLIRDFCEELARQDEEAFFSPETVSERILDPFISARPSATRPMVLAPVRVALTGLKQSPGIDQMLSIFGKKSSLERIKAALETIES